MNEKILEYLRKSRSYVSGEELSHRLGITRSAVWKNIHQLMDEGYEIAAVPHLGYKLIDVTDKLIEKEVSHDLGTAIIGKRIYYYESVGSTMDKASELAMQGEQEGAVIIAESQTKGRGRMGRHWVSPKDKGIYFSLILRPKIIPQFASSLTMVIAVSVAQAVNKLTGIACSIKWPNDILIDSKKLGGILFEMSAEMDAVKYVIAGVGINVYKSHLPEHSISLEKAGADIKRAALLKEILRCIEEHYLEFCKKGFQAVIDKWRSLSSTLNSRVKVVFKQSHIQGEAIDIDLDGGLLIRNDSGLIQKVMAGDVTSIKRL